jgi:glycosyltransferase involved in cell wall biosynthesis
MGAPPAASVSVIIPCYRAAGWLAEAVAAVRAQTHPIREIVIAAGSADDVRAAQELAAGPVPVRVVEDGGYGLSNARNLAIGSAVGPWVLPLDADDVLPTTFVAAHVDAIPKGRARWIVTSSVEEFGQRSSVWTLPPWTALHLCNAASVCSLFPRELWRDVDGYDPAAIGYEDWDFWLRCSKVRGLDVRQLRHPRLGHRVRADSKYETEMRRGLHDLWVAMQRIRHPDLYTVTEHDRHLLRSAPPDVRAEIERRRAVWPDHPSFKAYAACFSGE